MPRIYHGRYGGGSIQWGKAKENMIGIDPKKRKRLCFRHHDSLYVAYGRLRLRLMKPRWLDCIS